MLSALAIIQVTMAYALVCVLVHATQRVDVDGKALETSLHSKCKDLVNMLAGHYKWLAALFLPKCRERPYFLWTSKTIMCLTS